jgi:hypothetical protein
MSEERAFLEDDSGHWLFEDGTVICFGWQAGRRRGYATRNLHEQDNSSAQVADPGIAIKAEISQAYRTFLKTGKVDNIKPTSPRLARSIAILKTYGKARRAGK